MCPDRVYPLIRSALAAALASNLAISAANIRARARSCSTSHSNSSLLTALGWAKRSGGFALGEILGSLKARRVALRHLSQSSGDNLSPGKWVGPFFRLRVVFSDPSSIKYTLVEGIVRRMLGMRGTVFLMPGSLRWWSALSWRRRTLFSP
jgi:hypothetical protein